MTPTMTVATWWSHLTAGRHKDADAIHVDMLAALPDIPEPLRSAVFAWLDFTNRGVTHGHGPNSWRERDQLRTRMAETLNDAMDGAA